MDHRTDIVAYSEPDGTVTLCVISPEYYQHCIAAGLNHQQVMTHILQKDCLLNQAHVDRLVSEHGLSLQDAVGVIEWTNAVRQPEIIPITEIPQDVIFRDAWVRGAGKVEVSLIKAKAVAHGHRRARRAALFQPLDVEATIPAKAAQAEAARQVIRDADTAVQNSIDAATTPEQLKQILIDYQAV